MEIPTTHSNLHLIIWQSQKVNRMELYFRIIIFLGDAQVNETFPGITALQSVEEYQICICPINFQHFFFYLLCLSQYLANRVVWLLCCNTTQEIVI